VSEGQIKKEDVERWKWRRFGFAALRRGQRHAAASHATSIPPIHEFSINPDARKTGELTRATASYHATSCEVKTTARGLK